MADAHGAWRVPPGVTFEWRHYGDESVLFDPRSGLTHFVSAVAVETLTLLHDTTLSSPQLTTELLRRCDVADPEAFAQAVDRMLWQLRDLDLLQRESVLC